MKKVLIPALALMALLGHAYGSAQVWAPLLSSRQAIDWSDAGVGTIPARKTNCASLTSSVALAEINSALASCPGGQTVYLAAGTYSIPGTVIVPSNVTLRGAGAGQDNPECGWYKWGRCNQHGVGVGPLQSIQNHEWCCGWVHKHRGQQCSRHPAWNVSRNR